MSPRWERTGTLETGRIGGAAARLHDGRVLVCGGCEEDEPHVRALASTEIWDGDTWTLGGATNEPRWQHGVCATRTGALIFGGLSHTSRAEPVRAVERYEGGAWARCGSVLAPTPPYALVPLGEDRILLVGKSEDLVLVDAGELRAWQAPPMKTDGCAAVALADGSVLLVGGYRARNSAEPDAVQWDPLTHTWSRGARMVRARHAPTATLLDDGSVLVVGGYDYDRNCTVAEVELYDPRARTFTPVGKLEEARTLHTATRLVDGRVLIVGGHQRSAKGRGGPLADVVLYEPTSRTFERGPPLPTARRGHDAVALHDGSVMIVMGATTRGPLRDVWRWRP